MKFQREILTPAQIETLHAIVRPVLGRPDYLTDEMVGRARENKQSHMIRWLMHGLFKPTVTGGLLAAGIPFHVTPAFNGHPNVEYLTVFVPAKRAPG